MLSLIQRVHKTLNTRDISVHIDKVDPTILIKLVFEEFVYNDSQISNQEISLYALFFNSKIFLDGALHQRCLEEKIRLAWVNKNLIYEFIKLFEM